MKTITFQGTESQMINLQNAIGISDNDMPQQVETRVYVIEAQQSLTFDEKVYTQLTDEEFMTIAEENGTVYSIQVFQDAFNVGDVNSLIDVIRFINVPLN